MPNTITIAIIIALLALNAHNIVYGDNGDVVVREHVMYSDNAGMLHIAGIVENNTNDPIGFVRVTSSLFDARGNQLPKYSTLTLVRTILPGYVGPFDILVSDQIVGSKVYSYTVSLEWKIVQGKPTMLNFADLKTYTVTHMDPSTFKYVDPHEHEHKHGQNQDTEHEPHAHSETSGRIVNSGDASTKSIKVIAVWYDKQGKLTGVDWQVAKTSLAAREDAPFVIMTHKAAGYYSLLAESDDYVTMLTDANRRMIPVYEAPKAASYIVDAIGMDRIAFVDETNKPVSVLQAGHQVQLRSTIESKLSTPQKFVCIFQISDKDGMTVMLSWIAGEIGAGKTADVSVSWIPDSEGAHTIQTFLWQDMSNPVPLSETEKLVANVS